LKNHEDENPANAVGKGQFTSIRKGNIVGGTRGLSIMEPMIKGKEKGAWKLHITEQTTRKRRKFGEY